jgi:predicted transcriptional regulator
VVSPRGHMLYHMVMARKEILVQLDDDLVGRLDELARRMDVSRSELLRRGAAAVLEAAELAAADEALVRAYRAQPQDPLLVEAAARLASESGDPW